MSAPVIGRIAALLQSEAHERQIAAAIVLGELGVREAAVIDALAAAVTGGIPPVQRHALDALARLGEGASGRRAVPAVLAALAARDEQVRAAAIEAAIALGQPAVDAARARLREPTDPIERRGLEAVLGRAGGRGAFQALLGALDTPDLEAARAAALAVRQRVKEAPPRERAAMLAHVAKLLRGRAVATRKPGAPLGLVAGGLKILGFLEDAAAVPVLLVFARDERQPDPVRQEAIVALRFAAREKPAAAAPALVEIAERAPIELARAALYSLASLTIPAGLSGRLRKLALGPEAERAQLAIERLGQIAGAAGADALAAVLVETTDRGRAEAAATALGARAEGAAALARAAVAARDPERAALLVRLLRPKARALAESGAAGKKLAREIVAAAAQQLASGTDVLLPLAREIDRPATAAALRDVAAGLRKRRQGASALPLLRALGRSPDATPEDGFALAVAELGAGRRDEALAICEQLVAGGFDLAAAVRRERQLDPEQRYQIGFALVERRQGAGEEVLADLAAAGRGKVAKMAKAKLRSAGYV